MSAERIDGFWAGEPREVEVENSGDGEVYVGFVDQDRHARVTLSDLLTALAKTTGKRITVADVEVIPAQVKVTNEEVYGG